MTSNTRTLAVTGAGIILHGQRYTHLPAWLHPGDKVSVRFNAGDIAAVWTSVNGKDHRLKIRQAQPRNAEEGGRSTGVDGEEAGVPFLYYCAGAGHRRLRRRLLHV